MHYGKGAALGLLGHDEKVIAVYDDVLGGLVPAADRLLRVNVANALFKKGNVSESYRRSARRE